VYMKPAIFFDRDGTILMEMGYTAHPSLVQPYRSAPEALRLAKAKDFLLVVVTNQSGIARGRLSEPTLTAIHQRMTEMLRREGAALDAIYYCPHHPDGTVGAYRQACLCRKPGTALGEAAIRDLGIDPARSWAIGDKVSDIRFGLNLGLRVCLVRTGFGMDEEQRLGEIGLAGTPVADDILEAVKLATGVGATSS